jgi:phage-related baseplate assembly protein
VADAWPTPAGANGDINVYVLAQDGEPSQELVTRVQEVCNSPEVRLINDRVIALPAIRQEYTIKAEITVYNTHDAEAALDKVSVLAHEYARRQRLKLGQDVTPTQLLMALSPVGECLYHVNLIKPNNILVVGDNCFPEATEIDITLAGVTDG